MSNTINILRTIICKKCNTTKIANDENFYMRADTHKYRNECNLCYKERIRKKTPDPRRVFRIDGIEACKKCKEELPFTEEFFIKANGGKLVRSCKICNRKWHQVKADVKKRKNELEKKRRADPQKRAIRLEKEKQRRKEDVCWRIRGNLSCRLYSAVSDQKGFKLGRSAELIGCDYKFIVSYLESKFTTNMNWDNYGDEGWHIDHIIPCASFNLLIKEEQLKCFNYSNLQPLWATTDVAIAHGEPESYIGNINKQDKIL